MPAFCPWTARVWREFRADNLTRAYRDVLLTLLTYRGRGGLICPAHATLADRAGCSVSTVQRALAMGARLGLVSWAERRLRAGWRWLRTSNLYRLAVPDGPVQPGQKPAWRRRQLTTGQIGRGGERLKKEDAWEEMRRAAAADPDLLAQRRAAFMAEWPARWARTRRTIAGIQVGGNRDEPGQQ